MYSICIIHVVNANLLIPQAPCSGHGTCTCGKCTHCAPGYSGLFCQHCTNISVSATVVLVYMHDYGDNIMHSCVLHIDLLYCMIGRCSVSSADVKLICNFHCLEGVQYVRVRVCVFHS